MKRFGVELLIEKNLLNSIYIVKFDTKNMNKEDLEYLEEYEKLGKNSKHIVSVFADYYYYGVTFGWGFPPSSEDLVVNKEETSGSILTFPLDKTYKTKEKAFEYINNELKQIGFKNINTAIIESIFSEYFK